MIRLHVNVDHVATLRNARGTSYPDPTDAAVSCLAAGAHGITAHLREDRRHITDADVGRLRAMLQGRSTFNLEMAATDEMVGIALAHKPDVVTLVPERREERTTEGGLDVIGGGAGLRAHIKALAAAGIKVSLFIAPDDAQIIASKEAGAAQIELHTGPYAHAEGSAAGVELERLFRGARTAHAASLEVAAGHGLTRDNVVALCQIPELVELNIGHAIVADSIMMTIGGAVRAMHDAMRLGQKGR
jgi:pyridoxine 5-phosphate synthase